MKHDNMGKLFGSNEPAQNNEPLKSNESVRSNEPARSNKSVGSAEAVGSAEPDEWRLMGPVRCNCSDWFNEPILSHIKMKKFVTLYDFCPFLHFFSSFALYTVIIVYILKDDGD